MECPGCNINFNDDWKDFLLSWNEVGISVCPACHFSHVEVRCSDKYYGRTLTMSVADKETPVGNTPVVTVTFDCQGLYILPTIGFDYYRTPVFKEIPDSVPRELADDHREARNIIGDSPRSAALLARRILEKVLRDHGHEQRTLHDQIVSLENSKELSSIDVEKLQAVRNLGNIAAHYKERMNTLLDVELGEAELCLRTVDELFTHYYAVPAEVNRINQKTKD